MYSFHERKKSHKLINRILPQCLACSWNIMNCNKTHSAYIIMYIFLFVSWGHCFKSYVTLPWIVFYNWMRVCVYYVSSKRCFGGVVSHIHASHTLLLLAYFGVGADVGKKARCFCLPTRLCSPETQLRLKSEKRIRARTRTAIGDL